jgi:hypothetical protein
MLTAAGKLLAYKNAGQAPDVMREVLRKGLAEWDKLPASERRPGAVRVDRLPRQDPRYSRRPPMGGLIVDVYTRILDRDSKQEFCRGTCSVAGGDKAARDHLWLTAAEWHSLIPADPRKGDQMPMPRPIAERMLRYHLVDNTRGEPPMWQRQEIRSSTITLTVEEATGATLRLRLDGFALLATRADAAEARRGYQVQLLGYLGYDAVTKTINRFDMVAVGNSWSSGPHTGGGRPGRTPLGIAFQLAPADSPGSEVPPQGARDLEEYLGRGNH